MRAKLIKRDDDFYSLKVDGIVMATSNGMLVDYRLSLKNCDEIFGAVDVEKLADDYFKSTNENSVLWRRIDFKEGFNKAMELNRFTLDDIRKAYYVGYEDGKSGATFFKQLVQSLQQPTEIEVVIEMERSKFIVDKSQRDDVSNGFNYIPKLDDDGCLILKRIKE
jgi:hypothetical protein